jgi:NADH:ubiquinone oxidoreductase subunit B-like Fe-S oxidoreductase
MTKCLNQNMWQLWDPALLLEGLYFDSYNVLSGVDNILLADVYVPGCPPRPETHPGNNVLQEMIKRSTLKKV